eukprot:2329438-Amphidinium_carterae.1
MAQHKKDRGFRKTQPPPSSSSGAKSAPKQGNRAEEIAAQKLRSICAACGQKGHWKGDAICSKSSHGG